MRFFMLPSNSSKSSSFYFFSFIQFDLSAYLLLTSALELLLSKHSFFLLQLCLESIYSLLFILVLLRGSSYWSELGPVRRAISPRWDDFYPTFIWNLLSLFSEKVCYAAGKRLFDQVAFTINSDVKLLCRTNVLIWFN